jgi:hypothetical protein
MKKSHKEFIITFVEWALTSLMVINTVGIINIILFIRHDMPTIFTLFMIVMEIMIIAFWLIFTWYALEFMIALGKKYSNNETYILINTSYRGGRTY